MRRLVFLFLLVSCSAQAQFLDTLRACVRRGPSFAFALDGRNSFISDRKAPIWGIKVGATFGDKLTIGGGWNVQRPHLTKPYYFHASDGGTDTVSAQLNFNYFSYFIRYVYFQNTQWKFAVIPAHLGFGRSYYSYLYNNDKFIDGRKFTVSCEIGLAVTYKPVRWVGVGADVGQRIMLRRNKTIPENFNSPYYSFYLVIDWLEIYKTAFPNSKLLEKKPALKKKKK